MRTAIPIAGPRRCSAACSRAASASGTASPPPRRSFSTPATLVVVLGRYRGTNKATGRPLDAQLAHVWRVRDGKAVRFQQYTDTLQAARVTGAA